jgi:alanyl-tRNA synthetase
MNGNEIRRTFLEYFEKHGHKIVHSGPVYPPNDPTILFTNAGMNQFKDVFLGNEKREYNRAVSSQKCIRAGGKHNDLDEVGKTARHHTFFEMLGNFSFGDYFKEDAINFAWDFLVNELKIDVNRLWFTVFAGDDEVPADEEAEQLWIKAGAKPERILRFGKKDNFWQMADTGPCGPNSEINYYLGDEPENPEKNRADLVNAEEGDTTMEIWNLVFMQYNRVETAKGVYKLEPLPAPSVDTGAGLERMAVVLEGVHSNYETTLIKPIINFIAELAGKKYEYDSTEGFAMRVVADHARTTAFSIADGILPGNEGRNYVLRKIMRRAIYHGREHLGFDEAFFYKVCDFVVDQMNDAYPELEVQREFIGKMVRLEEERFGATLTVGLKKLREIMPKLKEEQDAEYSFLDVVIQRLEENKNKYLQILEKGISGESNTEQRKQSLDNLEGYGRGYNLDEFTHVIHENKISLLFALSYVNKNISLFHHDIDYSVAEHSFFEKLASVVREEGTDEEKEIVGHQAIIKWWYKLDSHYSHFQNDFLSNEKNREIASLLDLVRIYDTYGVPKDLIFISLRDYGFDSVVIDYFEKAFDGKMADLQQQNTIGQTARKSIISPIYHELFQKIGANKFHGYDRTDFESSKVLAIVKDDQQISELNEGDEGLIVLDETPFYAESGGQVGDTGTLFNGSANVKVFDTFAPISGIVLHKSKIEKGSIKVGDTVSATVDVEKRDAIRRNHTATHLVHAALREVLGTHVKQAGSVVAPNYLRFDYTHYQSLSEAEIKDIEIIVNREILKNDAVNTNIMAYDEAKNSGAMALFGEKYGSEVRVLSIGDGVFSKELCGGTHVRATGDIGSFKILSDEAVASGVRRIRAITGLDAFARFREDEQLIEKSLGALRTQRDNLPSAIEKLQEELKRTRREVEDLKMKIATGAIGSASSNGDEAKEVSGIKVITKTVDGLDKSGMRHLSDTLMAKIKSGVVILARTEEDKVSFIVRVSDDLTDRVKAGKIVQEIAPIVGGRGGGKADMAEGGGTDASKLSEALEVSYKIVEQMLG